MEPKKEILRCLLAAGDALELALHHSIEKKIQVPGLEVVAVMLAEVIERIADQNRDTSKENRTKTNSFTSRAIFKEFTGNGASSFLCGEGQRHSHNLG